MPFPLAPPPLKPSTYREARVLAISCLTSIATIIGSGILALPVSLYATSLKLFLFLFTTALVAQIGIIYSMVELMQCASKPAQAESEYHSIESPPLNGDHTQPVPSTVSLFSIAQLFLKSPVIRTFYYFVVFLSFISMLVTYGLAGPQAVWQLIQRGPLTNPPLYIFLLYWAIGTSAVIFFVDLLLGVFGSFTVLKGILFIAVVIIVALLPQSARPYSIPSLLSQESTGWTTALSPFLISCVALGGLPNTMPVTFKLLPSMPTKSQLNRYRISNIIAVIFCYLLNIGWIFAVLQVVPKTAPAGNTSLQQAYQLGQISTVPLIAALREGNVVHGAVLATIESIIEMFIIVSTSVSFFVIAAGLKSFVDGSVQAMATNFNMRSVYHYLVTALCYIVSFGSILAIIVANPDGFITVITFLASLAFNIQGGVLVAWMLHNSRKEDKEITLPMGAHTSTAWIFYCIPFFSFASILAIAMPIFGIE